MQARVSAFVRSLGARFRSPSAATHPRAEGPAFQLAIRERGERQRSHRPLKSSSPLPGYYEVPSADSHSCALKPMSNVSPRFKSGRRSKRGSPAMRSRSSSSDREPGVMPCALAVGLFHENISEGWCEPNSDFSSSRESR
jgi:hypothetical protein